MRDLKLRLARTLRLTPDGPPAYPPITAGTILPGSVAAGVPFPQFIADDGTKLDDHLGAGPWLIERDRLSQEPCARFATQLAEWLESMGGEAVLVRSDRFVFGTGRAETLQNGWTTTIARPARVP